MFRGRRRDGAGRHPNCIEAVDSDTTLLQFVPNRSPATVGIIANPASGRDIRRLTAKASVFPTAEKANMIERVLGALGMLGIRHVMMMPDMTGIAAAVGRAIDAHCAHSHIAWPRVEFLDMHLDQSVTDTFNAVDIMVARGVAAIVVLGGDGTHRAVAARCGDTPITALSTGTNNAFPELREATTAGLATGLLASGRLSAAEITRANKRLAVEAGGRRETALVDVCVTRHAHIASRAVWQTDALQALFVAFAQADAVGLSSIAGLLQPVRRDERHGLHVRFCERHETGARHLVAPIAPGLLRSVAVAGFEVMHPGRRYRLCGGPGTVAVDGEREIELGPEDVVEVRLEPDGPRTLDVARALQLAAARRLLEL